MIRRNRGDKRATEVKYPGVPMAQPSMVRAGEMVPRPSTFSFSVASPMRRAMPQSMT